MNSRDIHTAPEGSGIQKLSDTLLGLSEPLHCELVTEIHEAIARDLAGKQRSWAEGRVTGDAMDAWGDDLIGLINPEGGSDDGS